MRRFLERMMAGRYGADSLNRFLNIVILVLLILSLVLQRRLLYLIALILVFYTLFRSMSRNIYARRAEDDRFQHLIGRF
ncbi:MAG: hypothetical protein KBS83_07475, partial [Lachnospiraceae bacterium]|nr:hypothetical protein [Candidatus Equihabitans merdae]